MAAGDSALCVDTSAAKHISVPEALSYPKGLCSALVAQVELENLVGNEAQETPSSVSSTHHLLKANYFGSGGTGAHGSCAGVSERKSKGNLQ